jgi:hypothetical protein
MIKSNVGSVHGSKGACVHAFQQRSASLLELRHTLDGAGGSKGYWRRILRRKLFTFLRVTLFIRSVIRSLRQDLGTF